MRDSVMSVCRTLDPSQGGHPFDLHKQPFVTRRTLYGFVDRARLAYEMPVFDFASPSASTGHRPQTTVPQQALYMMNGAFVLAQARALANHPATRKANMGKARITHLFRQIFARSPSRLELNQSLRFIETTPKTVQPGGYTQLIQALLAANEFAFIE